MPETRSLPQCCGLTRPAALTLQHLDTIQTPRQPATLYKQTRIYHTTPLLAGRLWQSGARLNNPVTGHLTFACSSGIDWPYESSTNPTDLTTDTSGPSSKDRREVSKPLQVLDFQGSPPLSGRFMSTGRLHPITGSRRSGAAMSRRF